MLDMQVKSRVIIVIQQEKLICHEVFDIPQGLYDVWVRLQKEYPPTKGFAIYEGVASDLDDFRQRYPEVKFDRDDLGEAVAYG